MSINNVRRIEKADKMRRKGGEDIDGESTSDK